MNENEELLEEIYEERGKLKSELFTIKQFLKAEQFAEKILNFWRKGGKFVECEGCGGLCGDKAWDKIR